MSHHLTNVFTLSGKKQGRNVFYIYKKKRSYTVNSHVNSSESNNSNTLRSDNVIVNSNLPRINVQAEIPFNTLITLQKDTDTESGIIINDDIMDGRYISEQISSRHNTAEGIDHKCDNNEMFLLNT